MTRYLDTRSRFSAGVLLLLAWASALAVAAEPRKDRHGDPLPDGALARLGTVRQRVVAPRLAFSPDGRTLIACGQVISRWDAETGRLHEVRRLPGRPVHDCWLSADGRLLALNEDKGLAVFSTATGVCTRLWPVSAMRAAFRPDGKVLVTNGT